MPGKAILKIEISTYPIRTIVGSQPSHSAIPPQTPAIILLLDFFNAAINIPFVERKLFQKYQNINCNLLAKLAKPILLD